MAEAERGVKLEMEVPRGSDLPPAIGVNYIHFTYAAEELQLLLGTVDLLDVQERIVAAQQGKPPTGDKIKPTVTHRFLLSPLGVMQLRTRLNEIEKALAGGEERQAEAQAKR